MPGEYGTYVATRDIRIGNALAFRKGDAVPVSHVQSGVVSLNDVALAPDASPGPRDVFDERVAAELADPNSASTVALRATFVARDDIGIAVAGALAEDDAPALAAAAAAASAVNNAVGTHPGLAKVQDLDSSSYIAVELDAVGRISRAVGADGRQVIPRAQVAGAVTEEFPGEYAWVSLVDTNGRLGELLLDPRGRVPIWVLNEWNRRTKLAGRGIICRGHSMMAGSTTSGVSLPTDLNKLVPHIPIIKRAAPGESATAIAQRQGSIPLMVTVPSGVIAAGSANTTVTLDAGLWLNQQAANGIAGDYALRGRVNASVGTLTGTPPSNSGTYTFVQDAGAATNATTGAHPFINEWESSHRDWNQILWVARNQLTDIPGARTALDKMIAYQTAGDFLILTDLTRADEPSGTGSYSAVTRFNDGVIAAYGDRVLDVRRMLIDQGLTALGITPTTADTTAIAGDTVPPSLTGDGLHPTAATYSLIAQWVATKIAQLGWT